MRRFDAKKTRDELATLAQQFRSLDGVHPSLWPIAPRALLLFGVFLVVVVMGWSLYWRGLFQEIDGAVEEEEALKSQYVEKMRQAVNRDALQTLRDQVLAYVGQLEKQLPSRAEMDALLSEVNQAGVGRGASLQLFRPGQVLVRDYYAELPITVRVVGSFHDLAAFASDVSNLPRIVTINNLSVGQPPDGKSSLLVMDATVKTFRYLDPEEIAQIRQSAKNANPGGQK